MKWKGLFIDGLMLACVAQALANDGTVGSDTLTSRYEQRKQRIYDTWMSLVPSHLSVQNAGNMGIVSAGVGWNYGKRKQWETELLFCYIPRHDASRGKLTTTVKENYIPWSIGLTTGESIGQWHLQPFTASLYLNTVYGHEFWKSQPARYPDEYYEFMSTRFRLNLAFGQRLTVRIPEHRRTRHSSVSLFYEVSTCDLYVRALFQNSDVGMKDILGLSLGLKFYM